VGIRAHLKLLGESNRGKGRSEGIYSEEHFTCDPLTNTYRCPANQLMKPRRLHLQRLSWEYLTAKGTCLAWELRQFCTRSRTGRTIHRHRDPGILEKARKIANSRAAKRDLKRRQHLMERSFADATNCHGLKRARWRSRKPPGFSKTQSLAFIRLQPLSLVLFSGFTASRD
jgi:hypothetical protein